MPDTGMVDRNKLAQRNAYIGRWLRREDSVTELCGLFELAWAGQLQETSTCES